MGSTVAVSTCIIFRRLVSDFKSIFPFARLKLQLPPLVPVATRHSDSAVIPLQLIYYRFFILLLLKVCTK